MEKKYIKDKDGNKILPITHISAVRDDNGNPLDSVLGDFMDDVNSTIDERMDEQEAMIGLLEGHDVTVVSELPVSPSSGDEDKIFRVAGSDSYTDYMWQNNEWRAIATYDFPGIDDEPTAGSSNLVKSGGVEKYLPVVEGEVVEPTYTNNKYIGENGVIGDANGYGYTSPILLEAKKYIKLNGGSNFYLGQNTMVLSQVTSSGDYVKELLFNQTATTKKVTFGGLSEDVFVCICGYTSQLKYVIGEYDRAASERKLLSEIERAENAESNFIRKDAAQDNSDAEKRQARNNIGIGDVVSTVELNSTNIVTGDAILKSIISRTDDFAVEVENDKANKYIDLNGDVQSYNGYYISKAISLRKDDYLLFKANASGVAYVSKIVNNAYVPVLYGPDIFVSNTTFYCADEDCSVVLSYSTPVPTNAIILAKNVSNREFDALEANVEAIDESVEEIKGCVYLTDAQEYDTVKITGYYIDANGVRQPYQSYFISEPIALSKGDVLHYFSHASSAASLAIVNQDESLTVVKMNIWGWDDYTAPEDCNVVISGETFAYGSKKYTITSKLPLNEEVERIAEIVDNFPEKFSAYSLISPYSNVNYTNTVKTQSHEHCYDAAKLKSAYNRGIRVIACSHYIPSCPRYPLSNFDVEYQDLKSVEEVKGGDTSYVTRHLTGSIPVLTGTVDGDVNTDNIPQIANAERGFVHGFGSGNHCNILGLLWGSVGNAICDYAKPGGGVQTEDDRLIQGWKSTYSLESPAKFNELLEDRTMWQFGPEYAFGTLNHIKDVEKAKYMLDSCPQIFKAMEIFNQGYGKSWNMDFKNAYDTLLSQGYRIWGTAVVDWQGDWAAWEYINPSEQAEWTAKYNALSSEEQAVYGSARSYYMETGRYKFDRGCNVIFVPENYLSLTAEQKAKEVIKSYINGRYYMAGLGNYSLKVSTSGNVVSFQLSDFCPSVRVITANGSEIVENVDTINHIPEKNDMYVRIEAEWPDGDFVYSNPVWIE